MAGYLNEDVQKWYKENKDLIGVIETLTKRCKELEKKADLANADAINWQHKFFVESAREIAHSRQIENLEKEIENQKQMAHNRKRYDYIHHFDHVNKLSCRIKDLEKEVEKYKNEVRKLNAACQAKSVKIESLKKKLANKDIRIANNVTEPYYENLYVPDNDYYRVENLWEVLGGMRK